MSRKKAEPLPEVEMPDAGDLPEGWEQSTINELIGSNGVFVDGDWVESKDQDPHGDIRLIQLADIGEGSFKDKSYRFLTNTKASELNCTFLQSGDLLISRLGDPLGKCCIFPGDEKKSVAAVDICIVRPEKTIVDSKWLMNLINSPAFREKVDLFKRGTTRTRISRKNLGKIPFPLPPLAEQQRIVARIEALLSHVNAALVRLDRVPLVMKRFRQGVLAAACSGRLTEGWREANPEVESGTQLLDRIAGPNSHSSVPCDDDPPVSLPEIPESWEWSRCLILSDPNRDLTYGVIKLGAPIKGGVPTLRSSDVRWLYIDNSDIKSIHPDIASQYSRTFLKGGEIVITVRGSLGGIAVVPQSMAGYNISREVAVMPLYSNLDAKFFSYTIASIWCQNWLSEVTKGVAYTGINIRDLNRLPIPVPSLAEQHEIVRRVNALFARADAVEREVAAATKRAEALTQAVLGRAFAGKL